jgi:hypothetical protein
LDVAKVGLRNRLLLTGGLQIVFMDIDGVTVVELDPVNYTRREFGERKVNPIFDDCYDRRALSRPGLGAS